MVGGSLDQVNLMQNSENKSNNGSPPPGNTNQSVQLKQKIMGGRKRNAREKSYDSYN